MRSPTLCNFVALSCVARVLILFPLISAVPFVIDFNVQNVDLVIFCMLLFYSLFIVFIVSFRF